MTVSVYSSALYSLAEDMGIEDRVLSQIEEIDKALSENPDFVTLLNSSALALSERLAAADDAFSGAEEILLNFIKILTEKRQMHTFSKCAAAFRKEYDKKHNIVRVTALTVVPLGGELKNALCEKLEKLTGNTIVLENGVSPEILGGIVLKSEDSEIDASILGKLRNMAKELSGR